MKLYHKFILIPALFLFAIAANGQGDIPPSTSNHSPPVFMEAFAGDHSLDYQLMIDKKLQSLPKLGFFSVNDLRPEWGTPYMNDYMIQGKLTYSLIRGVKLAGGFIWNPIDGVRPSGSIIFSHGSPTYLLIFNPRIDLAKNPNFDAMALVEFKPKVSEKLNLYTRFQSMYSYNFGYEFHTRSYIMLRAGLTWKDITLGLAATTNWYGPLKVNQTNYGLFVVLNLF